MERAGKHGGDIYSYIELNGIEPLDYSANVNPLGMPIKAKEALVESMDRYSFYPDINCTKLTDVVSKYENIRKEYVLFGNGAADIIFRICYSINPKKALVLAPTFSEYEQALSNTKCEIKLFELKPEDNFGLNLSILEHITDCNIIFICNPNNPTGNLINKELMYKVAKKCLMENCLLVIDECFMDFVKEKGEYSFINHLNEFDNVIILKAFTKIFAMAGLRLGYCLCNNRELLSAIKKVGQPWSVSTPAQVAGIGALSDLNYLIKTIKLIDEEREFLTESLNKLGFTVFKSYTNFILFKTQIKDLYSRLYKRGVLIRKCSNFNSLDDEYYRIAVKSREDNQKLIRLMDEVAK